MEPLPDRKYPLKCKSGLAKRVGSIAQRNPWWILTDTKNIDSKGGVRR